MRSLGAVSARVREDFGVVAFYVANVPGEA
jgi:hypothetical protein